MPKKRPKKSETHPAFPPQVAQSILEYMLEDVMKLADLRVLTAIIENPGQNRVFVAHVAAVSDRQVTRSAKTLESLGMITFSQKCWVNQGEWKRHNAYYPSQVFDLQQPLDPNSRTQESCRQSKDDGEASSMPHSYIIHRNELYNREEILKILDFIDPPGYDALITDRQKTVSVELATAWREWFYGRQYGGIDDPAALAISQIAKGRLPRLHQQQLPADTVPVDAVPVSDWPTPKIKFDSAKTQPQTVETAIWAEVLNVLQRQMTRATFDTTVQGTKLVSCDNGMGTITVKNNMAKEWLENRLHDVVQQALCAVMGKDKMQIEFVLASMPEEAIKMES